MIIPERALWAAVIERAMKDAAGEIESGFMKNSTRNNVIRSAQAWFRKGGEGFQAICDLANIDASKVRAKAMQRFGTVPKRTCSPRKTVLTPGKAAA